MDIVETKIPSFEILYKDEDLVAIHKPAGYVVHRTDLCPHAPVVLQQLRDQLGRFLYPVHRLDRCTCGIVVFGFSSAVARNLNESLTRKSARKEYVALVRGWVDDSGIINHPLAKEKGKIKREACTHYHRLATCELPIPVPPYETCRYSLVKAFPETGRMHQIRRHFKHISHHIIGDTTYGKGEHNNLFREHFGIRRLLLQAIRLTLPHPVSQKQMIIEDTLDPEFVQLLVKLGMAVV